MSNPEQNRNLPTLAQWQARVKYGLRALLRDSERWRDTTLTLAPPDINTPHIDYLMRPAFVLQLTDTITALAVGVYQVEVHAKHRRHREADHADLTIARQHLTQAATALQRIADRARGTR